MIPVNIALQFSEEINSTLYKLNKEINENIIKFNKETAPHLTLLQFFCNEKDIYKINNLIKTIDIENIITTQLDCILQNTLRGNDNIYKIVIENSGFQLLHDSVKSVFAAYIQYPKEKDINFNHMEYKNLYQLIINNSKNIFQPHITIGISKKYTNINNNRSITKKLYILSSELELKLFKIGDYGTALPIY